MYEFGNRNRNETTKRAAQAVQTTNETHKKRYFVRAGIALVMFASIGRLSAQSETNAFVPFNQFLAKTKATFAASSLPRGGGLGSRPVVVDQGSFDQMRGHILDLYQGVQVRHSYALGAQTFDCIPVEQQPAVRMQGIQEIAAPPAATVSPAADVLAEDRPVGQASVTPLQPETSGNDAFGNAIGCEANTIPMRRVTLEEMTGFGSLGEFFNKGPNGAGRPSSLRGGDIGSAAGINALSGRGEASPTRTDIPPGADIHKHAVTYQSVKNIGGKSYLNIWSPYVADFLGEDFTLSQQWYLGYGGGTLQTVEAGWQEYPAKYRTHDSSLFIYSTRDNYRIPNKGEATVGCYNLDCGIFVQVNNSYALGSKIGSGSIPNGPQYEVTIEVQLSAGNWWVAVNGTWLGYYPGSFYRGGQLTRNATDIEFGGEAASDPHNGSYYYAPMGSGTWANTWWQHAAYQRGIWYMDATHTTHWASMTAISEAPSCYSVDGPHYEASVWGVYFFFGGPGGYCK